MQADSVWLKTTGSKASSNFLLIGVIGSIKSPERTRKSSLIDKMSSVVLSGMSGGKKFAVILNRPQHGHNIEKYIMSNLMWNNILVAPEEKS